MSDKAIEQEIQAKGLTAPRVTQQRIQEVIASEHYFTGYYEALMSAGQSNGIITAIKSTSILITKTCLG